MPPCPKSLQVEANPVRRAADRAQCGETTLARFGITLSRQGRGCQVPRPNSPLSDAGRCRTVRVTSCYRSARACGYGFPFRVRRVPGPFPRVFLYQAQEGLEPGLRGGVSIADPDWPDKLRQTAARFGPPLPRTVPCCRAFAIPIPGNPFSSAPALVGASLTQGGWRKARRVRI